MLANFVARMASLVPPLLLGTAIDAIFAGDGAFELPIVPNAWLPTTQMAQFWFSIAAIAGSFLVVFLFMTQRIVAPLADVSNIVDQYENAKASSERVFGLMDIPVRARAAQAHEFIADLPDGYVTRVGEEGVKLSGGQRQRIALARVVLADPALVVLDEATSAVDTKTELQIQQSIDRLTAERTTLTIAHRLSTIKEADTILVVEDGEIVERGDHEGLLEANGRYAMLWAAQAGDRDTAAEALTDGDD